MCPASCPYCQQTKRKAAQAGIAKSDMKIESWSPGKNRASDPVGNNMDDYDDLYGTAWVGNAFSLNMLEDDDGATALIEVTPISIEEARVWVADNEPRSCVGHEPTALLMSQLLKQEVAFARETVNLACDDKMLVGQYSGPRLAEGSTELPMGATIRWMLVIVRRP